MAVQQKTTGPVQNYLTHGNLSLLTVIPTGISPTSFLGLSGERTPAYLGRTAEAVLHPPLQSGLSPLSGDLSLLTGIPTGISPTPFLGLSGG
jgi:hypothetical protein